MNRRFKVNGNWWCPGADPARDPIAGELRFHPRTGLVLRAFGNVIQQSFGTIPLTNTTVHGRLIEGDAITLFNCFPVSVAFPARVPMQTSVAHGALIGAHVPDDDTDAISTMSCTFFNLNEWFGRGPLSPETVGDDPGRERIQFQFAMESREFGEIPGMGGSLAAIMNYGMRGIGYRCALRVDYNLQFRFAAPISLSRAVEISHTFEILLSLLVGRPSLLREILLWPSTEFADPDAAFPDGLRFGANYISRRVWKYDADAWTRPIAFPFSSVQDDITGIISKWFLLDRLQIVTHLLSSSLFGASSPFVEDRFLTIAQALEGFCRISLEGKYLNGGTFRGVLKKLKTSMSSDLPSEFQEKLRNAAGRLNEHTFRDRLLTLFRTNRWLHVVIADNPALGATDEQVGEFIAKVVKARNTYTHVESASQEKRHAITDWVVKTTPTLRAMLCLLLLREVGVDVGNWSATNEEHRRTVGWW